MRKLAAALIILLGLAGAAPAQQAVVVPATMASVSIAGTVAARTRIVSGSPGRSIYVTQVTLAPVDTSAVTFSAGTGTNCGSNTVTLTGVMTFAGVGAISLGTGYGAVWVLPQGYDLCITVATAAAPGSLAYARF